MLDDIYHKILWFCGFAEGEHVSDMLARQKDRLGVWWWIFPIITLVGFLAFSGWLFWHIATYKAQKGG